VHSPQGMGFTGALGISRGLQNLICCSCCGFGAAGMKFLCRRSCKLGLLQLLWRQCWRVKFVVMEGRSLASIRKLSMEDPEAVELLAASILSMQHLMGAEAVQDRHQMLDAWS